MSTLTNAIYIIPDNHRLLKTHRVTCQEITDDFYTAILQ